MSTTDQPNNDPIEDGHLELVGSDALAAIERSQIDTQIATAKKYPRSPKAFLQEASGMISLNTEVAEGCNYKLKRKGKDGMVIIEGPSVRLLEIAASAYGNLKYGSRTIAIDGEFITAQGVAFDLEKNVSSSVEVKRSIKGKFGRYSQDMIMVTANAAGAIARRNALNGIIPRVYVQTLADYAKKVALGDIKTLPERRQKAFDYFTKTLGVDVKLVLAYLEKKAVEDCTLEDVGELQELKTALKEGATTIEEAFSSGATQSTGQKPPLDPPKPKTEAPLPNEGPNNKGPKAETPPKPAPAEVPPKPEPEPAFENAAPAQGVNDDETATPPADPETPQQGIGKILEQHGVPFDDFTDWLVNTGRYRDAKSMPNINALPFEVCKALVADPKILQKACRIYGTKQA
jgi:hypothetical protein